MEDGSRLARMSLAMETLAEELFDYLPPERLLRLQLATMEDSPDLPPFTDQEIVAGYDVLAMHKAGRAERFASLADTEGHQARVWLASRHLALRSANALRLAAQCALYFRDPPRQASVEVARIAGKLHVQPRQADLARR